MICLVFPSVKSMFLPKKRTEEAKVVSLRGEQDVDMIEFCMRDLYSY